MTMSALVEAGLRRVLDENKESKRSRNELPELPSWSGGPTQVDVSNREALYAAMEQV